jgi:hypothetical protein
MSMRTRFAPITQEDATIFKVVVQAGTLFRDVEVIVAATSLPVVAAMAATLSRVAVAAVLTLLKVVVAKDAST